MLKPRQFLFLFVLLVLTGSFAQGAVVIESPLRIVVDADEAAPIHRAVDDLVRDIEKVLGQSPMVVNALADVPDELTALVVVGPAWSQPGLAIAEDITGFEAHGVYVAHGDTGPHVVMHGSDMRGTIYAIYTFAEHCLGVPPLWFWASWQAESKDQIDLPADFNLRFDPPQVRWRAWFPNDQRQITPWLRQSSETEDVIAEAMLRLKVNMIDVLSFVDASYRELYDLSTYGDMAKRFGLALTCTHTAPFGAHPSRTRWDRYWERIRDKEPPDRSIYDVESLKEYWTYYIEAGVHHDLEIVWPIAFRGGGDVGFWQGDNYEDPGTDALRAQVIQSMLNEQVALLKSVTGHPNPPMRVTLYNEKSDFVAAGLLELPEEPSLIYNFVAARRDHYPPPDLLGFDFDPGQIVGYYFNYQFTSTGSHIVQAEGPRKMEQNFRIVDDKSPAGVELAVVNAGNIREHVMELAAHARMMWDFEAYDSSQFLKEFAADYFGQEHAERIARFTEDYYNSYWQQMPGVLDGFERQFIFQDLRLHRAMRILIPELNKNTPSLDPFWDGDWFRIDVEAHGVDTQTEAVAVGMRRSLRQLIPLTHEADAIYEALPASRRTFFNDNFRVQAYFLRHATEVVYYLAEALIGQVHQFPERRARSLRLAAQSAEAMEAILADAEHGVFDGWYDPLRFEDITAYFRVRERRNEIVELLEGLEVCLVRDDFEDGCRDRWHKIPDADSFVVEVADDFSGLGTGKALFVTINDYATRNLIRNFDSVTLVNAGESIHLSFDVRLNGTYGSASQLRSAFRVGLYDSMETVLQSDTMGSTTPGQDPTDDDVGYFIRLACGDAIPRVELLTDHGVDLINGGADTESFVTYSAGRLNNHQSHTLVFSVSKVDGDALRWDVFLDGIPIIDGFTRTPSVPYFTFNEIAFSSALGVDFVVDNVEVITNAPVGTDPEFDECLYRFTGDLTQNCRVDVSDAAVLSRYWQKGMGLIDFLHVAEDWLRCGNLNVANCYLLPISVFPLEPVTIFETFDTDPLTRGWTMTNNGQTNVQYFSDYSDGDTDYVGGGNIRFQPYRETHSDRYVINLGQVFDQTQQFWMAFDMMTVWHPRPSRGQFGVFHSGSDNMTNGIVTHFFEQAGAGVAPLKTTAYLHSYSSEGHITGPVWDDYVIEAYQPVRTKIHYWYDMLSGQGNVSFEIWALNQAGPDDDVLLSSGSGVVVPAGTTLTFDSFGLANMLDLEDLEHTQRTRIDNLYFSTVGPNPEYVDPAFVPLP